MKKAEWDKLKNLSCDDLLGLLNKDGWKLVRENGAIRTYRNIVGRQVTIHYHKGRNYGSDLMKDLIKDIGWNESDFKKAKVNKIGQ